MATFQFFWFTKVAVIVGGLIENINYPCTGSAGRTFDEGELGGLATCKKCYCGSIICSITKRYISAGTKLYKHKLGILVVDIICSRGNITHAGVAGAGA